MRVPTMHVSAWFAIAPLVGALSFHGTSAASEPPAERTGAGLVALYEFGEAAGPLIRDRSGVGKPLDLKIEDLDKVRRIEGALEISGQTKIRSGKAAGKLIAAIKRSGELTVEAWVRPAKLNQTGPARIITLSENTTHRNFTLGQDGDKWDVRLRTSKTSDNGTPSLTTKNKSLSTKLTHIAFTRDRSGWARVYVGGKQVLKQKLEGSLTKWNDSYQLVLGDEPSGGRSWVGTYHLVAVYRRSLSASEINRNYLAGRGATQKRSREDLAARMFEKSIAPLLADRCLECHDSPTKEGGLDLSHRTSALAGGDSGRVIVPGKSAESLLWESVLSDSMPADRPPLSAEEKGQLRKWIDQGAVWSIDFVDPALYVHDAGQSERWIQRLTVPEYIETVRAAVGIDIADEARASLPRDLRADGFTNTAYNLNVDLEHVEAYAQLAQKIVRRMDVLAFARQFSKNQKFTDKDMGALIEKMGTWLLRGPLQKHEVIAYRGISTTVASAGGSFEEAVGLIIEAMLQSPRFIYRMENQRGDGSAWPVAQHELASRLSYILWGGPPDKKLADAALAGKLGDADELERQVHRMLEDPRAIRRSAQFVLQWLNLDGLDNLQPSPQRFPDWNQQLAADMRAETLAFFEHVVWTENRPLAELLSARVTFATPELARHYRLKAQPEIIDGSPLAKYDLSSSPERGGLLTQGSVLTMGGDDASMVTRGLFVLHDLLRGVVKDPPPCVNTTPVPTRPGVTQRTIATARIQSDACGGCHSKFEPLAFGLERFDGLGTYRETDEHGNELRDDGEVLFPGQEKPEHYASSTALMELLSRSDRVRQSLSWKVTQFALGRPLTAADAPIVDKIHKSSQAAGGTYRSLMTAIVMSDLVQLIRTEPEMSEAIE